MADAGGVRAGKAYVELGTNDSKLLKGLSFAMKRVNKFAKEARQLGGNIFLFGSGALGSLAAAVNSFAGEALNPIKDAVAAVRHELGSSLNTALQPYIEGIAGAIRMGAEWVSANPELIGTIADLAVGVTALGAALTAVGGILVAITSPAVLITGIVVGLGTAVLAVTDALGVTSTGFGDLWNSIRVGGQGLGTWLAKFWTYLEGGFELALGTVTLSFAVALHEIRKLLRSSENEFTRMSDAFVESYFEQGKGLLRARKRRIGEDIDELNRNDPNDGSTGVSFDTDRALGAISTIGATIRTTILQGLSGFGVGSIALPAGVTTSDVAALNSGALAAESSSLAAQRFDVLGVFNASAAGQLGFGSSVEERQARAAEKTASNTAQILSEIRDGGATFQ